MFDLNNLPIHDQRPDTVSEMLIEVARWLDLSDYVINAFLENLGKETLEGDDIQRDLEKLADWFKSHPRQDRKIVKQVFEDKR